MPTRIDTSTMVDGPCLEIPAGAVVTIPHDKSLVIVATRKLRIGDGVKIVGRGATGAAGAAAATETKEWIPSAPDQSEKINCACRNVRCKPGWQTCNAESDPDLRGGRGGAGKRGATVFIVARELLVGNEVRVDLSGGLGGEAGPSGHVECHYGGMECSVTATSEGDGPGGPDGTITVNAALPTALAMMIAIERFATPPSIVTKHVVDTVAPFHQAVEEARTRGASFDRTPGQ